MNVDNDDNNWVNRVREFREYLDKFQYSDTEDNLLQFEKELEKIANKTLKIYAEETLKQEEFL
jgi:hypothetical protein